MKNIVTTLMLFALATGTIAHADNTISTSELAPGVYKLTMGTVDKITPFSLCENTPKIDAMQKIATDELPFALDRIVIRQTERGCTVAVPLSDQEQLYGFGLQIGSFEQRGLKKQPIVNDNPLNTLGYTHAPETFYISTSGYGILVNTNRYTTFHCGTNSLKDGITNTTASQSSTPALTTEELYKNKEKGNYVFIDIPGAKGIDVFVIKGKGMRGVVERYNLLSGGGCLPPMWGLGIKYRVKADFKQDQVIKMADYFRTIQIPCDVLGLEPGWQTASYSCSYVWNEKNFPEPKVLTQTLSEKGFRVNLWEHAYTNPKSPFYEQIKPYSGDFLVWNGLVPDFTLPEARKIFAGYHKTIVEDGISGFKLDECDNSNIGKGDATWGFPDMSQFPSGMDGEQMHQVFGLLYLKTMSDIYKEKNQRTYMDYRASGLFASSLPGTLYSDTYDHKEYIQMICNSAFGGLLWSPELRESANKDEFVHRFHTVLLSAQAVVNSWYLQNPPWLQYDRDKNNKNLFLDDAKEMEDIVRSLVNMRMSLIPYLYTAFANYHYKGTPPFRPLIMDYPNDKRVRSICDQYMMGDNLMAAPLYEASSLRKVYFPEGIWYNLNTGQRYDGCKEYDIETQSAEMPLYVKSGTILPLAEPVQSVSAATVFNITCKVYGENAADYTLFEDDGTSFDYERGASNEVKLSTNGKKGKMQRSGSFKQKRYVVKGWEYIR